MKEKTKLKPFDNFKVFDGYHCQTNSFAKIYDFYNSTLSEDMLLGIGSGVGFMYWHQKGTLPFIGGRDNNKNFHINIGERTGVVIKKQSTSSASKAEKVLIEMLNNQQPVMMFVDMGFLPCFDFGAGYHFGGHTHVVCGFDGKNTVLISEMKPEDAGLKRGFVYDMSLEQLAKARGSKFKPFPPQNAYFIFDFTNFRQPTAEDIFTSIRQTVEQMLNPPIKNFGTKGIRKAGSQIKKWEKQFTDIIQIIQSKKQADVFIQHIHELVISEGGNVDMDIIKGDQINVSGGNANLTTGDKFYDQAQKIIYTTTPQSSKDEILKLLSFVQQELPQLPLSEETKEEVTNEVKGAEIQAKKDQPNKEKIAGKLKNATEALKESAKTVKEAVTIGNLLGKAIAWCGEQWIEWMM